MLSFYLLFLNVNLYKGNRFSTNLLEIPKTKGTAKLSIQRFAFHFFVCFSRNNIKACHLLLKFQHQRTIKFVAFIRVFFF